MDLINTVMSGAVQTEDVAYFILFFCKDPNKFADQVREAKIAGEAFDERQVLTHIKTHQTERNVSF